jgi:DNA polymerase-3 subunit gamma/tau
MSGTIITKYRPRDFDEVLGHEAIMGSLQRAIASDTTRPHAYLLTGSGGLGKTTLARIIAKHLGADVHEIDAASNNGIDDMRALIDLGSHMSLTGDGRRMFIIDECHGLSKNAWQSILKMVEEPPEHLFIALCTTELAKVPATIKQRCFHAPLKPLGPNDIGDLVAAVADAENWDVPRDVQQAVVQAAGGSPRAALSMLQSVNGAQSRDEVKRIIELQGESEPLLEIARMLVQGVGDWTRYREQLIKVDNEAWEGAPEMLGGYIISVMEKAETAQKAEKAWGLLEALLFPANSYHRKAAFYAALGRMLFVKT